MIIGVDVDDTVLNLVDTWLKFYNRDYNDTLYRSSLTNWDIASFTKPACQNAVYDYLTPAMYDHCLPIEGALAGVNALRELGHRVVFVTSTRRECAGRKLDWLVDHGFLTLKYNCISDDYVECHDKGLVAVDILVDDGAHNLDKFKGLPLLFDQPWNRDAAYTRAYGWSDVPDFVKTYGGKPQVCTDAEVMAIVDRQIKDHLPLWQALADGPKEKTIGTLG